ncbi:hypothetical protein [Tabrizicola sp.]|uniref:hypothetical protein n=1 Tax=Tabrizicola sp. TaxID=2005166 RepID=UPI003F2D7FEE
MAALTRKTTWQTILILGLLIAAGSAYLLFALVGGNGENARALEAGQPAPVAIETFTKAKDIHFAREVHVSGRINQEHTYELVERDGTSIRQTRHMFVLFAESDPEDSKVARAVILIDEGQFASLQAQAPGLSLSTAPGSVDAVVNGRYEWIAGLSGLAKDALEKDGLSMAPEFIFIEPWSRNREADLAPLTPEVYYIPAVGGAIGLILLSLGEFLRRRNARIIAGFSSEQMSLYRAGEAAEKERLAKSRKRALLYFLAAAALAIWLSNR